MKNTHNPPHLWAEPVNYHHWEAQNPMCSNQVYHENFTKVTTAFKPVDPVAAYISNLDSSSKSLQSRRTVHDSHTKNAI